MLEKCRFVVVLGPDYTRGMVLLFVVLANGGGGGGSCPKRLGIVHPQSFEARWNLLRPLSLLGGRDPESRWMECIPV